LEDVPPFYSVFYRTGGLCRVGNPHQNLFCTCVALMANLLNQELLTSFGWSTCTHVQCIEHDGNQKFEKLSLELQDWQGWTSSKPPMLYLTLGEDSNPILQSSKFSVGGIVSISTETEMCMGVVLHYNREEDSYTVRGYTGQAQHYFDHKNSKTLTDLKTEQLCKADSRNKSNKSCLL